MSTVTLQDAEDAIRRAGRELDRARQAGDDAARRSEAETAPGALMSQLNDWYVGWADGARRRFRRQLTDEQVAATTVALFSYASERGHSAAETAMEIACRWDIAAFAKRYADPEHAAALVRRYAGA